MSNEMVLVLAMLYKLNLLTKKEVEGIYDELKYKNIPTSYDDCLAIISTVFDKLNIGKEKSISDVVIDGKRIKVTKDLHL